MYRGFHIDLDGFTEKYGQEFDSYGENGKKTLLEFDKKIQSTIDNYASTNNNDMLDGQKILDDWFPVAGAPRFHAFLSHSHLDMELANKFAGWLYKHFKIESFIDSMVWNHSSDLKKLINDKYCKNNNTGSYDHNLTYKSSTYVDNMLLTSLNLMMNSCEVIFFLESKNSISDKIQDKSFKTLSPWIFSELKFTKTLQKKKPERLKTNNIHEKPSLENFDIELPAHLDNLVKIGTPDLERWEKKCSKKENCNDNPEKCLDFLYEQHTL